MSLEDNIEQMAGAIDRATALMHKAALEISVLQARVVFWRVLAVVLGALHLVAMANHYIFKA